MARRKKEDIGFGTLSFIDVLANSVGAMTFIFLMFFIVTAGLVARSKLQFLSTALPEGRLDSSYYIGLSAAGGTWPYKWRVVKGNLPDGLALDRKVGAIAGTPRKTGNFEFTVELSDSHHDKEIVEQPLAVRVRKPSGPLVETNLTLEIANRRLTGARVGDFYNATLSAVGGREPYSWHAVGGLPTGLILSGDTISGIPGARGKWRLAVRLVDREGIKRLKRFSLNVKPKAVLTDTQLEPMSVVTKNLPGASVGRNYDLALTAEGGVPPYTWSIMDGELPYGMKLDPERGVLSGKPLAAGRADVTLLVRDARIGGSSAQKRLLLKVDPFNYLEGEAATNISWSVFILLTLVGIASLVIVIGFIIGVQCPWDKSWRCRVVGKDDAGRNIYLCKHGHRFVTEPRLLPSSDKAAAKT